MGTSEGIVSELPRTGSFARMGIFLRRSVTMGHAWMSTCEERLKQVAQDKESGLATAEYAVVMIGATAFAGVLVAILKSGTVKTLLTNIVKQALSV